MPSEYQSDATCTEFDHEIGTRLNLGQKPLKNLNSNISGSEGNSTLDLGTKHQTLETVSLSATHSLPGRMKHRSSKLSTRKDQTFSKANLSLCRFYDACVF